MTRRSGLKLLAKYDNGIERLEAVERGNWQLIKVHFSNGEVRYINSEGPVAIDGGIC